jgi:hypothetical protein
VVRKSFRLLGASLAATRASHSVKCQGFNCVKPDTFQRLNFYSFDGRQITESVTLLMICSSHTFSYHSRLWIREFFSSLLGQAREQIVRWESLDGYIVWGRWELNGNSDL